MQYRKAKLLQKNDQIILKIDKSILTVLDIEIYGSVKKVRINCLDASNNTISLFNDEIE